MTAIYCFSQVEQNALLRKGCEFDQGVIHEKYRKLVERGEISFYPFGAWERMHL
jgi:hypothetical protein